MNLLWESSQSTNWKLALASVRDLKIPSQNLLHIHVTFPQLQAPTLDSHPSLQLKYARHDILAFIFYHHLPLHSHIASVAQNPKKKIHHTSVYVRYQSNACVGTSSVFPRKHSKSTVSLIRCRLFRSEFVDQASFFKIKSCAN